MQARPRLPMWISVGMLLATAAAIPLTSRSPHPRTDPPRSLREFKELLSHAEPNLYIVPAFTHCPERGVLVSERPLRQDQAYRLLRVPEYAHRWQGIILCEQPPQHFCTLEEVRESWGEHGMQIG